MDENQKDVNQKEWDRSDPAGVGEWLKNNFGDSVADAYDAHERQKGEIEARKKKEAELRRQQAELRRQQDELRIQQAELRRQRENPSGEPSGAQGYGANYGQPSQKQSKW